MGSKQGCTSAW